VGAKTRKIEIGTAVIDMRYENPYYMAEDAGGAEQIGKHWTRVRPSEALPA
jgi:alkanesulfonate monooxygenase SsuD/methylene tetrahydromethanopterin reductase-like flavin-dependent oxidoreductase (luciferase family)